MGRDGLVNRFVRRIHRTSTRRANHPCRAILVCNGCRGRRNERVAAGNLERVEGVDRLDLALALLNHRLQVLVKDLFLLICNLQEALVDRLEFLIAKRITQLGETMAQCRMARTCRKDNLGSRCTHVLGIDNLVGVTRLEHAILVNARAVCKRISAHNGLVGLHVDTSN